MAAAKRKQQKRIRRFRKAVRGENLTASVKRTVKDYRKTLRKLARPRGKSGARRTQGSAKLILAKEARSRARRLIKANRDLFRRLA